MNDRKIGREVMRKAEELKMILEEQSGSRKHRRSRLTALNKLLVIYISRKIRPPLTITSNDAHNCYDK